MNTTPGKKRKKKSKYKDETERERETQHSDLLSAEQQHNPPLGIRARLIACKRQESHTSIQEYQKIEKKGKRSKQ